MLIRRTLSFRSIADVGRWVLSNGGTAALRIAIAEGRFVPDSEKLAKEWLALLESDEMKKHQAAQAESEQTFRERATSAAERSATASEASATAALRANRIAWLALWVAVAALLVSGWGHIERWFQ